MFKGESFTFLLDVMSRNYTLTFFSSSAIQILFQFIDMSFGIKTIHRNYLQLIAQLKCTDKSLRSHRCLIAKYLQFPWNSCGEKDTLDQDFPVNIDSSEREEKTLFDGLEIVFFGSVGTRKKRVIIQSHSNIDFMLVLEPHTSTLRTMGIQL